MLSRMDSHNKVYFIVALVLLPLGAVLAILKFNVVSVCFLASVAVLMFYKAFTGDGIAPKSNGTYLDNVTAFKEWVAANRIAEGFIAEIREWSNWYDPSDVTKPSLKGGHVKDGLTINISSEQVTLSFYASGTIIKLYLDKEGKFTWVLPAKLNNSALQKLKDHFSCIAAFKWSFLPSKVVSRLQAMSLTNSFSLNPMFINELVMRKVMIYGITYKDIRLTPHGYPLDFKFHNDKGKETTVYVKTQNGPLKLASTDISYFVDPSDAQKFLPHLSFAFYLICLDYVFESIAFRKGLIEEIPETPISIFHSRDE